MRAMKKNLRLFCLLFLAVLIALSSGANAIPVQAAGADAPLAVLTPTFVPVVAHQPGNVSFQWRLDLPLTQTVYWTIASGQLTQFKGNFLYIKVGNGSWHSYLVKCDKAGTGSIIQLTPDGLIYFNKAYLNCTLPSIAQSVHDLGYPYSVDPYEDFRDTNGTSNTNLSVTTTAIGSGTIFKHPSMELTESGGVYTADIYDDRGHPAVNHIYTYISTKHVSPVIGQQSMIFGLTRGRVWWNGQYNKRAGQNFAWWMDAVDKTTGKTFTIARGLQDDSLFYGSLGDLSIDPRTSQSTAGKIILSSNGKQDGRVLESSETSNVGGTLNSVATTFNLGDDATKKQYRGILSFSTGAALPDTAVITGVTLKVKQQAIVGGGNPVTIFQGFMADVKNGTFGTMALQTSDFQAAASATYGPFTPALAGGWYSIDLKAGKGYINKLATGSGLTQIRLRFKLDDNNNAIANYLSLFSGDAPAANQPQLVITYYMP
jgi:hypothetical protein